VAASAATTGAILIVSGRVPNTAITRSADTGLKNLCGFERSAESS
jgi:hypothetical protein